jgi:ribosome maturation factor RimP
MGIGMRLDATPLPMILSVPWAAAHFFVSSPHALRGTFGVDTRIGGRTVMEYGPAMVLKLDPVAKKVTDLLEPHVARQGFELVMVEFRKGSRNSLLRLLVDKPEGGIALSDLERLSPIVGDLLDVYDPVEGRYTLEVASPGINRPLVRLKDFEAYRGQRVRLRTHQARDGRKNFEGVLTAVTPGGIELEDDISHRREAFGFEEIKGANYEHRFE